MKDEEDRNMKGKTCKLKNLFLPHFLQSELEPHLLKIEDLPSAFSHPLGAFPNEKFFLCAK